MPTSPQKSTTAKPEKSAKTPKADKPARAAKTAAGGTSRGTGTGTGTVTADAPRPVATKPDAKPAPAASTIKLRNLIDTVAATSGMKKPEAKKAVEAVLAAIGSGLAAKSVLNVPPLGKVRVAKANGSVLTLKLRLADASRAAGLALADEEEDS